MKILLQVGRALFRARSWTPVPLALWTIAHASPRKMWFLRGLMLVCAGLLLRLWAVAHIGPCSRTRGDEGPTHLATGGPYAFVRHPLYLANGVLSGGLIVASGAGWPWLQTAFPWLWLLQYGPIMLWEEHTLRRRFGHEVPERESSDWRAAWRSERRTRQSVAAFLAAMLLAACRPRVRR